MNETNSTLNNTQRNGKNEKQTAYYARKCKTKSVNESERENQNAIKRSDKIA